MTELDALTLEIMVARRDMEIARLRAAMNREADDHDVAVSVLGATPCRCPFCLIAREGR